ncbi:MAG: hypothetical protein AB1801_07860 [Chloroflexota bacterium]
MISSEIANPYTPGEPVAEPAMLFGRQDAADWIELHLNANARVLILSGSPLMGKTSFIKHVGALQNLAAYNLRVELSAIRFITEAEPGQPDTAPLLTVDTVLQMVIDQLKPPLARLNLVSAETGQPYTQTSSMLRHLFTQANKRLGPERLVLYFDDLHLLFGQNTALGASFLTALVPLLDECSKLHLIFTLNHDSLKQIQHPLLEGVPTFNLGPLATDASLNMVTLPVKNILRFDYGVTKRIVEVNSHHPYYLSLFCHTLLNRQLHDGWVNQRDFDSALVEILDSPIEPFTHIWERSSWVERAVLSGMAAIQGTHGPLTQQEVTRFLQRQDQRATANVVVAALKGLAERGVLVPMGAISYRFHVELLRLWLREHTHLAEILREVDWERLSAQLKPDPRQGKASTPPIAARRAVTPPGRRLWPLMLILLAGLCLLTAGGVLAARYLDLPLFFVAESTAEAVSTPAVTGKAAGQVAPTVTQAPQPTPTITPTPPLVVARTLPSITYMGRDIDQAWRIYVMNADGSGPTPISPEGTDDTAPIWSPNGQKIAFVSFRDGNREIYIMDADGQNAVNITRHPADDWTPSWSPDGTKLAFSSIRTGGWEIYGVDLVCLSAPETCPDNLTQLTSDDNGNILPVWSPDGTRFAFNSKAGGNWDVFTMAANGADLRQITTDPANDLAATWSPDGTQLAFESNRDGNVEVYVIDANGQGPARNVTNLALANDHGPAWTPDGQQLVFYSNREGNWDIFSTTLDGQTVLNLTQTPARDEQTPAWRP